MIVLLFGAKKLPELARGSGRALRIFKAETKGLMDDDEDDEVQDPRAAADRRAEQGCRTDITPSPAPSSRPTRKTPGLLAPSDEDTP